MVAFFTLAAAIAPIWSLQQATMSLRATRTVYWDKNGWTSLVIPRDALIVLNDTVARCRRRLP